jgi:hypothetical protein
MHPGHALFGSEVHDALAIVQEETISRHEERSFAVRRLVTPVSKHQSHVWLDLL